MLDYKKLDTEFTNLLNQFDKERLEQWIAFDQKRLDTERFLSGESVPIHKDNTLLSILSDPLELISTTGESNYALAA